jgi:hypothetical protein
VYLGPSRRASADRCPVENQAGCSGEGTAVLWYREWIGTSTLDQYLGPVPWTSTLLRSDG